MGARCVLEKIRCITTVTFTFKVLQYVTVYTDVIMIVHLSRWTGRLANYWTRKVDVINRGYSGYNTVLGLNILEEMVLPLNPAFITIFFGANDASIKESKQVTGCDYRSLYASLLC